MSGTAQAVDAIAQARAMRLRILVDNCLQELQRASEAPSCILIESRDARAVIERHLTEALAVPAPLLDALQWFVDRSAPIQAKLDLFGPADTATAMRVAFADARIALAMVRP